MKLRDVPDGEVFVYYSSKTKDRALRTLFSLTAPAYLKSLTAPAYLKLEKNKVLVSPNSSLTEPIAEFKTGKILFANPDSEVLQVGLQ